MAKDRKLYTLYFFFLCNFVAMGMTTYAGKYYGEIGLTDGQIGLIAAVLALVGLFAQPAWGIWADRAKAMRSILFVALLGAGLLCFLVPLAASGFVPLLLVLTLYNTFFLPTVPVSNALAIEYTRLQGRGFGPVRMMGTIGYQVGILGTGFLLAGSLSGLYPAMGVVMVFTAGIALFLPRVQATPEAKADLSVFFKDRDLLLLFALAFLANIGHQFNLTFFTKHLGDLGMSNAVTGMISALSPMLEVPFLFFGDRIMKRFSIWTWMRIGLVVGALRFGLLALVKAPALIILVQLLSIAHFSCFEFFPYIYLGSVTRKDLLASAQSVYQMITFGIARIVASLLGGAISDAAGIPFVYGLCAGIMAVAVLAFYRPMREREISS